MKINKLREKLQSIKIKLPFFPKKLNDCNQYSENMMKNVRRLIKKMTNSAEDYNKSVMSIENSQNMRTGLVPCHKKSKGSIMPFASK